MTEFRVYFCAPNEQIMGRYEFEAPGDESALRTAELLGVACYDTCSMVDLWQGARRVGMVRDLSRTRLETIAEPSGSNPRFQLVDQQKPRASEAPCGDQGHGKPEQGT